MPNDCPFCLDNNLFKGEILATSEQGFLTTNAFMPGNFLIIPKVHIEQLTDLPDTWWVDVKTLLPKIPGLTEDFNMAVNYGKAAGQSLKHLHFWIIPRVQDKPSSGKGLARFIAEADKA
jgi:diadenosine tetraphosphate (Ap4A) HIT family hydrolase